MTEGQNRGKLAGYDRPSALGIDGLHIGDYLDYQSEVWTRENGEPKYTGPIDTTPAPSNVEMYDAWRTSDELQQIRNEIFYRTCLSKIERTNEMALNVSDYQSGNFLKCEHLGGEPRLFKIAKVTGEEIQNKDKGTSDKKLVVHFEGQDRALALNVINMNTIKKICGNLGDAEKWAGFHIVLFPTETEFGGEMVPCVRVRAPKGGPNEANEELIRQIKEAGTGQEATPDADIPF